MTFRNQDDSTSTKQIDNDERAFLAKPKKTCSTTVDIVIDIQLQ
jgi:hypothetical protein